MKELSIEEKAKRYDEALKEAVIAHKDEDRHLKATLERIFPELKESEDERIRGAIIDHLKDNNLTEWAAWLEKQGEQHPKFRIGDTIEKKSTGDIVTISEIDLKNREYRLSNTGFIPFKYENLWKLVEQKPTDKVKPKFHEGEWITNGDYIWKIVEVKPLDYILQSQDGNIVDDTIYHVDEQFHSFAIQDAKDGDVLASEDKVFLYNGKLDLRGRVCAYCGIYKTYDGLHFTKCVAGNYFTYKEPYPATKEQSDLLFQKMKEAGYVWDADKKRVIL